MSISVATFVREYCKAIQEGYAAIFAGAGLSKPSGFISWKELLEPIAKDIDLDITKESDLISLAQFYRNKNGNRHQINQRIINEFTKEAMPNSNLNILTRLPITTYWTTNYDELIEDSLRTNCRKPDVKATQKSLANNIYDRDAIVYKMHGDVRDPDEAVLTKDDYETYNTKRPLFTTALQGDLISKTFLFIGFSFEDPNLDYILGRIRVLLGESVRNHYCFFEKVKDNGNTDEYAYDKAKQELRISDLSRYGIQAVLLESYDDITDILMSIEKKYMMNSVFISGSISNYDGQWKETDVAQFTHLLSKKLIERNFRVVSGFGLGIGSAVINGALEEIVTNKFKNINQYLCLRPFPQIETTTGMDIKEKWTSYRESIATEYGIGVFIFGNKIDKVGNSVIANGMIEEFEIAKKLKKIIIPVGVTGDAAKYIFDKVVEDIDNFPYIKPYINELQSELEIDKLIAIIIKISEDCRRL